MKTMNELDGLPSEKFDILKALETELPPLDFVLPGLLAGLVVHWHYSEQADLLETYPRMEMSLAQPSQADLMERGIKDGEQRRHVVLSSDGRDFDLDLLTQKERWFWRGDNGLLEPAVLI